MRRRTQRGVAMSSPVALLSVAAVVVAGAAFLFTGHDEEPTPAATPVVATSSAAPTSTAPAPVVEQQPQQKKKVVKKKVRRGGTYVEVYNNSGISGLAGSTAARAQGAGWQVVGSDNWYGTIAASTVYFPARLKDQAQLLGKDLGIKRLKPAIAPMRGDRLTVILTRDYS
ncbi:LytR C-terminal domain-containing protein [Nocardioides panacis]|uniref:LytR C-terminal domain-containing protein n=1 Tax=Nocardioides panacis TaxID=2849501 RepID=A0A975SY98_9ACTN|nr:LytR C-terminal domain-containing protein [Nocardioides panacis]QWZ08185.1 LytR C-terminal domain-containing protein [Nocardioides panacis]